MQIVPEEVFDLLVQADELLDRLIAAREAGDTQAVRYVYDRLTVVARRIKTERQKIE